MQFNSRSSLSLLALILSPLIGCGANTVGTQPADVGADVSADVSADATGRDADAVAIDTKPLTDTSPPDLPECNTLAAGGAEVTIVTVKGVAPSPTGGTITPGTYHLTEATFFKEGSKTFPGLSGKFSMRVGEGTLETVADDGSEEIDRTTSTFTVSGTELTAAQTCPAIESSVVGYTATASSLSLYYNLTEDGYPGTLRYTFAR